MSSSAAIFVTVSILKLVGRFLLSAHEKHIVPRHLYSSQAFCVLLEKTTSFRVGLLQLFGVFATLVRF